jgi:hypothetical protein
VGNSEMDAFFDQFIQREFDVGTYNGIQYQDCGATENKEAQYCNAVGIPFVGIFLNKQTHYSHRKSTLVEQGIKEVTVSETFGIE